MERLERLERLERSMMGKLQVGDFAQLLDGDEGIILARNDEVIRIRLAGGWEEMVKDLNADFLLEVLGSWEPIVGKMVVDAHGMIYRVLDLVDGKYKVWRDEGVRGWRGVEEFTLYHSLDPKSGGKGCTCMVCKDGAMFDRIYPKLTGEEVRELDDFREREMCVRDALCWANSKIMGFGEKEEEIYIVMCDEGGGGAMVRSRVVGAIRSRYMAEWYALKCLEDAENIFKGRDYNARGRWDRGLFVSPWMDLVKQNEAWLPRYRVVKTLLWPSDDNDKIGVSDENNG